MAAVNRKKDKSLEIHQNLEFNGGIGATLWLKLGRRFGFGPKFD